MESLLVSGQISWDNATFPSFLMAIVIQLQLPEDVTRCSSEVMAKSLHVEVTRRGNALCPSCHLDVSIWPWLQAIITACFSGVMGACAHLERIDLVSATCLPSKTASDTKYPLPILM
jgi:hypothetical protein